MRPPSAYNAPIMQDAELLLLIRAADEVITPA
jgi:hypothetical protein